MLNKYRKNYIRLGKCVICCKVNDNLPNQKCIKCSNRQNTKVKAIRLMNHKNNLCRCGKLRYARKACEQCYFIRKAYDGTGSGADWKLVQKLLEEQDYRCAYTGEKLIPGDNASLDHKVPVSRGGSLHIDNVQWVTFRINDMKTDFIHDEFLNVIRFIYRRHNGFSR